MGDKPEACRPQLGGLGQSVIAAIDAVFEVLAVKNAASSTSSARPKRAVHQRDILPRRTDVAMVGLLNQFLRGLSDLRPRLPIAHRKMAVGHSMTHLSPRNR